MAGGSVIMVRPQVMRGAQFLFFALPVALTLLAVADVRGGLGAASLHSGHLRGLGPEPGTWKDPDPRRRSSRFRSSRVRGLFPQMLRGWSPAAYLRRPICTGRWLLRWASGSRAGRKLRRRRPGPPPAGLSGGQRTRPFRRSVGLRASYVKVAELR